MRWLLELRFDLLPCPFCYRVVKRLFPRSSVGGTAIQGILAGQSP